MNSLIYGKRRQGKSTLALALAVAHRPRVAIFDPNGQYPLVRATDIRGLWEWTQHEEDHARGFSVVRVGPYDTGEVGERFEEFAEILQEEREISVVVDEAHLLQGPNWLDPYLDRWNRRSPASVHLIQATHRIVDAHPDSRYHADNVFFFYADLPRELKTVRDNFGAEIAEKIPVLPTHHVARWSRVRGGIALVEVWDRPDEWYIDLENDNQ